MVDRANSASSLSRGQGPSLFCSGVNPRKIALIDANGVGDSLLDIGCGNGLYPLATKRRYSCVLQLDLVDRRDPAARSLDFRVMDAAEVASLGVQFDTVLCFDIIEHLDNDHDFVKAVKGICNGVLIGSVPADDDAQLRRVGLTHVHHIDKTHRREYSVDSLRHLLLDAGYTTVDIVPQWNEGLVYAAYALRTRTIFSRLCAKLMIILTKVLCRLGVFRNESVADWLFVAK